MSIDKNYCCIILAMKKIIFTFALSLIILCGNYFAYAKEFPNKINDIINSYILSKVRDLDTYEPVPKHLQDKYIKNIPENLITNYQIDMAKALKHVLNDKITYNNMTLKQMLLDFNKKSDNIYQQFLKNENDKEQNKVYIEKLEEMNGTISLYPNVIIEEVKPVIDKYCLDIEPGSESDIFLYKYYIEKYQVKYSKELKELLQLKEYIFTKIYLYQLKISNKI